MLNIRAEIDHWIKDGVHLFQAFVRNSAGEVVETGPVRLSREEAVEDALQLKQKHKPLDFLS